MADHEFFGTMSVSEAGTDNDHVVQKLQVDTLISAVEDALADGLDTKANVSHTQSADTITDGTTNKVYTAGEKTKLSGIANGATANATDASLRDFSQSTGTRDHNAISDWDAAVDGRIDNWVGAAPETLNQIAELADAIANDPNFAGTISGQISTLDGRVDLLEANSGSGAYKTNVGNASDSVFTVTHNLGTVDILVIVRRVSDGQRVYPVDKAATDNTATVDFGSTVPASNSYRVIVQAY